MYHVLFHAIITNVVPVTILQAYISLPRHIGKGVLIRRINASDLCGTAVGCQQFRKESRKRPRRIMFKRNYSLFPSLFVVFSLSDVPKTVFCINLKGRAQEAFRGAWPPSPLPPRSNGTDFIEDFGWNRLGFHPSEMMEVMEDREMWRLNLKLLPSQPSRKGGS